MIHGGNPRYRSIQYECSILMVIDKFITIDLISNYIFLYK